MRLNTFKMAAKCLYQAPHLQYRFCIFFFFFDEPINTKRFLFLITISYR